jgi:hypothetical protein
MRYHPDDFLRLAEAVEEQQGALLPDPCVPQRYSLKIPDGPGDEPRWEDFYTAGCNKEARFVIPYPLPKGKAGRQMESRGAGFLTACAVDDDMGKWPRFASAMQEDSY